MKKALIRIGFVIISILILIGIWIWSLLGKVTATHEYLISKYYRFQAINNAGIIQYFQTDYNYLESIELFIANIYPETEGKIAISLVDENGEIIFSKKYKASSIPTGEFKEYKIREKLKEKERYAIYISYIGEEDVELGFPQIMVSERTKNLLETQEAVVEEQVLDYNVAITYHYAQRNLW